MDESKNYLLVTNRYPIELTDWEGEVIFIEKYKCSNCKNTFYLGDRKIVFCPICSVKFDDKIDISL